MPVLPSQRALFDIPDEVAYLNCAYMSPSLKRVVEAGKQAVSEKMHPWNITAQDYFTVPELVRAAFSRLIGAATDDIALVPSVSYGISVAAHNLLADKGKRILVLEDEFPSNYYAWQKLAKRSGASVYTVKKPEDGDWTRALLAEINEQVTIVAVPHCHWTDGGLIDLPRVSKLCRELSIALVVDGTQSIGALPLSVAEIDADFIVTAGYKWMMGPYSYSYMYVAPRWQEGKPIEESWLNRKDSDNFSRLVDYQETYRPGARRFDVGQHGNFALSPMALVAIEQLLSWGADAIAATLGQMTGQIASHAKQLGMSCAPDHLRAPHMIGLRAESLPGDLLARLASLKIYVSKRGNALRVSPHLYNTGADIDRFFNALGDILASRR